MVMGDWYFSYDNVDRLVSATPDQTAPSKYLGTTSCWTWGYDSYGNRTQEAYAASPCPGTPTDATWATYSYSSLNNRIATSNYAPSGPTYDNAGNTLKDGRNQYWYDADGQLCAVQTGGSGGTITQYAYDAAGARIAEGTLSSAPASEYATCPQPFGSGFTLTKRYLVDLGGDQVTEMDGANPVSGWAHSNVWLSGRLTATYNTNGIHMELEDPLGTKRVQVNNSGLAEQTCTSLPFGNDINNHYTATCTGSGDATEHHFTQKERDTESGNDYFFARYYTSAMGRFLTPDWSERIEPVPYMVLNEPQSLNLYSYVGNNPLTHNDPDGHACQTTTIVSSFPGFPTTTQTIKNCAGASLDYFEENLYHIALQGAHATSKAAQGVDWFNKWLGFGQSNCSNGGDCGDALFKAFGAITAAIASDGQSEDAEAAKIEEEIATLSQKWSKGTFETLDESLAYHFEKHGLRAGTADSLLQYLRQADSFAENLQRSRTIRLSEGATKFIKNGRFLIKDVEGKIVSFGGLKD
jgi:RHS repeat-associated protein